MDPEPGRRRRNSKELPPDLSELMNKLTEDGASFIRQFSSSESNMRCAVGQLRRIAEELKAEQEKKDMQRNVGAAVTGVGLVGTALTGGFTAAGAVLAAPFTGGLSLVAAVPVTAAVAAAGFGAVLHANYTKIRLEAGSAKEAETLGKDFQQVVEPLKKILEEIQTTCERLEQKSTEVQAKDALRDMQEFEELLRRVSDLRKRSEGSLEVAVRVIKMMLLFIVNILKTFPTPERDRMLRESIIQSADQSQRVIDEFDQMKEELSSVIRTK